MSSEKKLKRNVSDVTDYIYIISVVTDLKKKTAQKLERTTVTDSATSKKRKFQENATEECVRKKKQQKDNIPKEISGFVDKKLEINERKISEYNKPHKRVSNLDISDNANDSIAKVKVSKMSMIQAENVSTKKKISKKNEQNVKNQLKDIKNENNSKIKEAKRKEKSLQAKTSPKEKKACKVQKDLKNSLPKKAAKTDQVSSLPENVNVNDPLAMLMMMEGNKNDKRNGKPLYSFTDAIAGPSSFKTVEYSDEESDDDDEDEEAESEEMSEWEEVQNHSIPDEKSQLPDKPVEITLEMPDILKHKKRKKKTFDWKAYLVRRVKRFKKDVAIDMHKAHLLCLLSLGLQQNQSVNDPTVMALALSHLPSQLTVRSKASLETYIENLLLWYKKKFPLEKLSHCSDLKLVHVSALIDHLSEELITDARVWILIFIVLLRSVGLFVRLIFSFQPMPFKVTENDDKNVQVKQKQHKVKKKETKPKSDARKTTSSSNKKQKTKVAKSPDNRRSSARESGKKAAEALKKLSHRSSEDEDNEMEDKKMKKSLNSMKTAKGNKKEKDIEILNGDSRKILSSDDEGSKLSSDSLGHDFWLEIYFPQKKKWICFDSFKSLFGKPYSLENSATQPLSYVLGFKNDDSVKDLTARYAKQWLSHTRKLRADEEWWTQTLLSFDRTPFEENLLEDDDIKSHLLVRPMPQTIGEFKNHPLYALQRHLLKFEAIYPETAVPLGYIRNEPVYARECVRTLHSRDNWLKEGRLVRLNEKPYKMVKSRPKWNKPKEDPNALDLELFGEWQTEIYMAPPAFNGKVPKNDYGNVELFKPWMLPKGTVQIRGQGMQKVAKKLNIDIAAAMIGWDYHSGHCVPLMDGWIVCEEFADTLMAAWLEDQEIQKQREEEAIEKRVYGNWRRLIRGLLIKERLKKKFLQNDQLVIPQEKQETFSEGEEAHDIQYSWPCYRQEEEASKKSKSKLKQNSTIASLETKKEENNQSVNDTMVGIKDEAKLNDVIERNAKLGNLQGAMKSQVFPRKKKSLKLGAKKNKLQDKKNEETSSGESDNEAERKIKAKGVIVSQKKNITNNLQTRTVKGKQSKPRAKNKSQLKNKSDSEDSEEETVSNTDSNKQEVKPRGRPSIGRMAKANIKFVSESNSESQDEESEEDDE
ncbi:hypothetical protein Btru_032358 [Bulinus truncatus]|nr:hypothetical protein Btru_032358 [Bulinus truncatus]